MSVILEIGLGRHSLHTSPKELLEKLSSLLPNVDEFSVLVNEVFLVFPLSQMLSSQSHNEAILFKVET